MSHIEGGVPAFPVPGLQHYESFNGMTLRQYAAIKLRVPESGTDWLDAMILQSRRDELAGKAMQALIQTPYSQWPVDIDAKNMSGVAYEMADVMIAAGKGGAK